MREWLNVPWTLLAWFLFTWCALGAGVLLLSVAIVRLLRVVAPIVRRWLEPPTVAAGPSLFRGQQHGRCIVCRELERDHTWHCSLCDSRLATNESGWPASICCLGGAVLCCPLSAELERERQSYG